MFVLLQSALPRFSMSSEKARRRKALEDMKAMKAGGLKPSSMLHHDEDTEVYVEVRHVALCVLPCRVCARCGSCPVPWGDGGWW